MKEYTLQILSHTVTVIEDRYREWDSILIGKAHLIPLEILMNEGAAPDIKRSTLIHEILHIIADMNSLDIEESQIDALALGMHSLLVDNPEFITNFIRGANDTEKKNS